jgi:hypothetical protein
MPSESENQKREELPVTLAELKIIVEALDSHHKRSIKKANRHYKKIPRPVEASKELGKIQETLQYCTLIMNIRTNKLNEALAESAFQATLHPGEKELAGDKGEETTMS